MRNLLLATLLLTVPALSQQLPANAHAKQDGTTASDGITREQANAILDELKAIHRLLDRQQVTAPSAQAQPQPQQKVKVSLQVDPAWHVMGREDAPITVIEFSDYQCPFCRKHHNDAFAELKKNYIDTGKIRYISRDFPLNFHANASSAALAARCAADQDKFWEMRDLMLSTSADLAPESITKYAEQLKLDGTGFRSCMSSKKYNADIQKDIAAANTLGVAATPSFVIGKTAKDKIDGVKMTGALAYKSFEGLIQEQLQPQAQTTVGKLETAPAN